MTAADKPGLRFGSKNNVTIAVNSGLKKIHRKAPASICNEGGESGEIL